MNSIINELQDMCIALSVLMNNADSELYGHLHLAQQSINDSISIIATKEGKLKIKAAISNHETALQNDHYEK